ncbi:FecR family protein [Sphingobacterium multivorum]|uniref:FecR family protein n=1 Tax=Sphingobacterium multivorum TaxID=28454 RepID=UPI00289976F0|nr:FecR domain-containing protein [Sphingobacterium multivorum]
MENQDNLYNLLLRYTEGRCSQEEVLVLLDYFGMESDGQEQLMDHVQELLQQNLSPQEKQDSNTSRILDESFANIMAEISPPVKKRRSFRMLWYVSATAALLLAIFTFSDYLFNKDDRQHHHIAVVDAESILPGTKKAILTLADGRKIAIDGTESETIASGNGIDRTKNTEGELAYKTNNGRIGSSIFNAVETPNGGEYKIRLPDGTQVWLNAGSKIRYPISFAGSRERTVELSGEAYFEVAHDRTKPFRVRTQSQVIEVLGTHFNVNAYPQNGKTISTLTEGSVRVASNGMEQLLKPGQEAVLNKGGSLSVRKADLEIALAWRNGLIKFRNTDLRSILDQAARWYDIDVEYRNNAGGEHFTGGISRTAPLSVLLKVLELNDVRFKVIEQNGRRKLIVNP